MTIAILDIDGTLVDTNYHHALAWFRALRSGSRSPCRSGRSIAHIGMGGDQMVSCAVRRGDRARHGDAIREAEGEEYAKLIGEVKTVRRARELIVTLSEAGHRGRAGQFGQGRRGRALRGPAGCP